MRVHACMHAKHVCTSTLYTTCVCVCVCIYVHTVTLVQRPCTHVCTYSSAMLNVTSLNKSHTPHATHPGLVTLHSFRCTCDAGKIPYVTKQVSELCDTKHKKMPTNIHTYIHESKNMHTVLFFRFKG